MKYLQKTLSKLEQINFIHLLLFRCHDRICQHLLRVLNVSIGRLFQLTASVKADGTDPVRCVNKKGVRVFLTLLETNDWVENYYLLVKPINIHCRLEVKGCKY